jgi:hypothetical protein
VTSSSNRRAPAALHLVLALLIGAQGAINLVVCIFNARGLHLIGFHAAEVVGALLFVWPRTAVAGAWFLVCIYVAAAGVHAFERNWPFEHLIYAVAVLYVAARHDTSPIPENTAS